MIRSFKVLRRDQQLVLFPILSALGAAAVSVPFFLTLFSSGAPRRWDPATILAFFVWYCAANFVMVFFNCALAASAQAFFDGTPASVGQGISQAASRAPAILFWSVISGTVGLFLRWLDERAGLLGRIVIGLFGIGWSLATYLIVPVLVIENRGAVEAIRRSGELLRKTWGEQICAGIAFGWAGLLFAIPGVIIGAIGMNGFWPLIPVAVLYFVGFAAAFSAARQIFTVALYRYATTGEPPDGFTPDGLHGAIVPR
jgi:hypothetical protein